jgi:hypothetical protein
VPVEAGVSPAHLISDNAKLPSVFAVIPSREDGEGPLLTSSITQATYRLLRSVVVRFGVFHLAVLLL